VRGLKLDDGDGIGDINESHPSRVRGLKPSQEVKEMAPIMSHPSRVRGLKLPSMIL